MTMSFGTRGGRYESEREHSAARLLLHNTGTLGALFQGPRVEASADSSAAIAARLDRVAIRRAVHAFLRRSLAARHLEENPRRLPMPRLEKFRCHSGAI